MTQNELTTVHQGRTCSPLGLNIPASVGAKAKGGAPPRESINFFVGSANYCRPDS